jgi:serine/threonine protein phosphatase 1
MPGRLIAIGDIHGCLAALETVLRGIDPQPEDTIVALGDYIDRGMHTREVIERLIELGRHCRLVPILGNHDELLLYLYDGGEGLLDWLSFGGTTTLYSYGCQTPEEIPARHIQFLRDCLPYYETEKHFFVHASYVADLPLALQPGDALRWWSLRDAQPGPHCSGKRAIVGHTAQKDGQIVDLGHLVCIDTCCYGGGWLTAMDVHSGKLWQASQDGKTPEEVEAGGDHVA